MTKVGQGQVTRKAGTTPMDVRKASQRAGNRTGQHGRISHMATIDGVRGSISFHPDRPRPSSHINDNYCITMLQERLLAGSPSTLTQTMNTVLNSNVNCHVAKNVHTAPGPSQTKEISPASTGCYYKKCKLKYVKALKGVSCVIQLSCVEPVTNVATAVQNLPVGARLQNFWQTWLNLGAGPKIVQILKEGYTLPFRTGPNVTRSPTVISCYVNHHRNLYLLEALHQFIDKNAVELVKKNKNLWGFQPTIFSPKAQQVQTYVRSEQTKSFSQVGEIQNGDTGNHQDIPPTRGVGHLNRFQGCLLPHTNTGTVQEIPELSSPGSDIPVQSSAFRFVHSTHGFYCGSKGGETGGHTQGYKNPPEPRRLVGESQVPPSLSPAFTGFRMCQDLGWLVNLATDPHRTGG